MLGAVDPFALFDLLEEHDIDIGDDALPHGRLYAECLAAFLVREGGHTAVNFAAAAQERRWGRRCRDGDTSDRLHGRLRMLPIPPPSDVSVTEQLQAALLELETFKKGDAQ